MSESQMVYNVTLAIIRAFFDREPDQNGERTFTVSPADNEDLAIAALKAIREPTDAMVRAGECEVFEHRANADEWALQAIKEGWQAMIDEALK
jgi:hypothetical protein